jgi:hypothetical protein
MRQPSLRVDGAPHKRRMGWGHSNESGIDEACDEMLIETRYVCGMLFLFTGNN